MATDVRVEEIHPDLRRVARFAPRQIVYPWSLPLLRRLPMGNRSSDDGVDVVDLPSGAGARPVADPVRGWPCRPSAGGMRHPR